MPQLLALIQQVLEARTGATAASPALTPLEVTPDPLITHVADDQLLEFVGEWAYPPAPLGREREATLRVTLGDGHLVAHHPLSGTFRLYLQPDGSFHQEDTLGRFLPVRNDDGSLVGLAEERLVRGGGET